jgi:hypothetical protein
MKMFFLETQFLRLNQLVFAGVLIDQITLECIWQVEFTLDVLKSRFAHLFPYHTTADVLQRQWFSCLGGEREREQLTHVFHAPQESLTTESSNILDLYLAMTPNGTHYWV